MPTVNIAFSGGIESTALLQKALMDGHNVNVCMINVHGAYTLRLVEIMACEALIDTYKYKTIKSPERYPGEICDIIHVPVTPWVTCQKTRNNIVSPNITQQFATALGMLAIRREYFPDGMPSTWIGWIKEDTSDHSYQELEFSDNDYKQLLNLPKLIGSISNADKIGVSFRAPFWDYRKEDIYREIDDDVKHLIIPNGTVEPSDGGAKLLLLPHAEKFTEWERCGAVDKEKFVRRGNVWVRVKSDKDPQYTYRVAEASFIARYMSGMLLPIDAGLDDSVSARKLMESLSPYFARGRTVIRPEDSELLKVSVIQRVQDIISVAQSLPVIETITHLKQ